MDNGLFLLSVRTKTGIRCRCRGEFQKVHSLFGVRFSLSSEWANSKSFLIWSEMETVVRDSLKKMNSMCLRPDCCSHRPELRFLLSRSIGCPVSTKMPLVFEEEEAI